LELATIYVQFEGVMAVSYPAFISQQEYLHLHQVVFAILNKYNSLLASKANLDLDLINSDFFEIFDSMLTILEAYTSTVDSIIAEADNLEKLESEASKVFPPVFKDKSQVGECLVVWKPEKIKPADSE